MFEFLLNSEDPSTINGGACLRKRDMNLKRICLGLVWAPCAAVVLEAFASVLVWAFCAVVLELLLLLLGCENLGAGFFVSQPCKSGWLKH